MSSESHPNPESSPAQDQGRTLSSDERLSAANREVEGSFDAAELAVLEGTEAPLQADESEDIILTDDPAEAGVALDEIDPEIEAEDPVDVQDAESVEAEEVGGDDATPAEPEIPPALRAEYDDKMARIEKGLQKRLGQLADKEKQLDTLILQNRHMMDSNEQVKTEANKPQRPQPPGEGATAADWQTYEDAVVDYRLSQSNNVGLDAEAQQRLAVLEQKQALDSRLAFITSQPGATDEIMGKMQEMAAGDDKYMKMYYTSEDTAAQFFNEAKLAVREEAIAKREAEIAKESATEAKATATRKAGAANRAVARPGGSKAASTPANNFNLKSFNNVDEALADINAGILADAGAK